MKPRDVRRASEASLFYNFVGEAEPHPNAGCVLVDPAGNVLSKAYHRAQVGRGYY